MLCWQEVLFLHGRHHRTDMDALATRTQWSHERYHRVDMDACGHGCSGKSDVVVARNEWFGNTDAFIDMDSLAIRTQRSHGATKCRKY